MKQVKQQYHTILHTDLKGHLTALVNHCSLPTLFLVVYPYTLTFSATAAIFIVNVSPYLQKAIESEPQ